MEKKILENVHLLLISTTQDEFIADIRVTDTSLGHIRSLFNV